MSDTFQAGGSCLCGAVRVTAKKASRHFDACHCSMCRTWSGGPLLTVNCGSDVSFEGEENVGRYSSSDWAERGFCRQCGTHLFYRLKANDFYAVPLGLFGENDGLRFHEQIFIDEKPAFYDFANQTENLTGAEVFAKYAPSADQDSG